MGPDRSKVRFAFRGNCTAVAILIGKGLRGGRRNTSVAERDLARGQLSLSKVEPLARQSWIWLNRNKAVWQYSPRVAFHADSGQLKRDSVVSQELENWPTWCPRAHTIAQQPRARAVKSGWPSAACRQTIDCSDRRTIASPSPYEPVIFVRF